jgi:hypothetical protein
MRIVLFGVAKARGRTKIPAADLDIVAPRSKIDVHVWHE